MRRTKAGWFLLPVLLLVLAGLTSRVLRARAQAPQQPASGPGGADGSYKVRESTFGTGGKQYWLYEPEPSRGSAPVILFLHGWGAMTPGGYRLWIDHLVERGNIVIYPRYQENGRELPPNMTPNAMAAIADAFSKLGNSADRSKFAIVGHSVGGILTFNVAAEASSASLPTPRAIMAVEPADTDVNPLLRGLVK